MADTGYVAIEFFRACGVLAATSASSRIYMNQSPQNAAYPHVVLSIISREPSPTQDSGSAVDTYRIQVDCYAKPSTTLSGFKIASTLANDIRVAASRATNESDYDHIIDGIQEGNYFTDYMEDIDLYRVSNDYMVRVKPETSMHSIVASGTYTPTISSQVNIDSITIYECRYMRIGNVVSVSGGFIAAFTNNTLESQFKMTIPIASAVLSANRDLTGWIVSENGNVGRITSFAGLASTNILSTVDSGTVYNYSFEFTYDII